MKNPPFNVTFLLLFRRRVFFETTFWCLRSRLLEVSVGLCLGRLLFFVVLISGEPRIKESCAKVNGKLTRGCRPSRWSFLPCPGDVAQCQIDEFGRRVI